MGLVHFEKPIKIMLNRQLLFAPLMSIENFVKLWHVVSFPSLFRRFRPKVILPMSRDVGTKRGRGRGAYFGCSIGNQNLLIQKALNYYLLLPPSRIFRPSHGPEVCLPRGTRSNSRPRKTEIYLLYLDKQLYHICTYKRHM